jgi:hypothetical protein
MNKESNITTQSGFEYETVAASQTDQVLGNVGAIGDRLETLIISVVTAATSTVSIKDGSGSSITLLTGAATVVPGVYPVNLGIYSTVGAWSVTTGAGATVLAIGRFS